MILASARLLRRLATALGALVVLACVIAAGLAWRLAQGPLPLDPLARFIEARVAESEGGRRVEIGAAALVWEGFHEGIDRPIDLRLAGIRFLDSDGTVVAEVPEGTVSLGLRALLLGRIEPRALEFAEVTLRLRRGTDGAFGIDLAGPRADREADDAPVADDRGLAERLLAELGLAGEGAGRSRISRLARLRITRGVMLVEDDVLGLPWRVDEALIDLRRLAGGGAALVLEGLASFGPAQVAVAARGDLSAGFAAELVVETSPFRPSVLASLSPALAHLAALDGLISASARVRLAEGFTLHAARIDLAVGEGRVVLPDGGGVLPIASARAILHLDADGMRVENARLVLPGRHGPAPSVSIGGRLVREGTAWRADARLAVDAVALADLPLLWPEGVGRNERAWITANLTEGLVRDARFDLALRLDPETGAVEPVGFSGTASAEGVTVHYLRPLPPVTGVAAEARFGLDRIEISARDGVSGGIRARSGTILLSGLDTRPQWADIALSIEAPVAEAIALLSHPKLALFARRGPPPPGLSGRAEVDLVLRFPLLDSLTVDELDARATARITEAGLPAAVLDRPLERGRFALTVDRDGLKLEGTGQLAGLESNLSYEADFRAGPPSQVIERATLRLAPQAGVAEAFGLSLSPYVMGAVGGEARLAVRRDRQATVGVRADLTRARLALPELGWEKPAGERAMAEATARLVGPRLTAIELTRFEGAGLAARGRARFDRDGRLERVEIADLVVGRSRAAGEVRAPNRSGDPWVVVLRGSLLDLSRRPRDEPASDDGGGLPIVLDARFERVLLGAEAGRELRDVAVSLTRQGGRIAALDARGRAGTDGTWQVTIRRSGGRRSLEAEASDAGAFLAALGVISTMSGGRLRLSGSWDDGQPGAALVGEATIEEFRLREAPAIGRVLQAMTLYGLIEVARGPGLSFLRLVAPFSYDGERLELRDARAFGASLGFTARGTVDLGSRRLAVDGTIVPAYALNAVLGHIPLLGRLFSPEAGGGVFAATYRVRSALDDPEVSVNPLAALTPGFLRGLFGLFEGDGTPSQPQAEAERGR